jgi:RNA polymerase sigma-70 factor (ECF subfamily)
MSARETTLTDLQIAEREAGIDVPLQLDEDAFHGFYQRTSRQVWSYLHRLTGDAHTADDLLQETYFRFLRAETRFETETHRRHYLFRIATNLASDRFRRTQTRPVEVVQDLDGGDAARQTPALDQQIDMNRALGRLGRRERAMLVLAYVQGASHEEIAGVLGLRTASVKTLLFRARRRLAQLLGRRERES